MEEYAKYLDTLINISRREGCLSVFNQPINQSTNQPITDHRDAPPTRRRVTPLTPPARSPLGGPDQPPALLRYPSSVIARSKRATSQSCSHFPEILVDDQGTIVLCPECRSSNVSKQSAGSSKQSAVTAHRSPLTTHLLYVCNSCRSAWRQK